MDQQESSTVFERIDETSSEDGIAGLTSTGGVECLPATRRGFSLTPLLREEFAPLFNFQYGDVNSQNTYFIAVVANLRQVLQPVMDTARQYRWKDYVNRVRTSWHGKYTYGPGHHGQHDAAELLEISFMCT